MQVRHLASAFLAATAIGAVFVGATSSTALAQPPRPDPWVQGQIDALTEDVPGFLDSINRSGIDRGGITDTDLVIKGHRICAQIYGASGDLSSAALPNTRPDDFRTMEIVAGASVKYLCPPAAEYVGPDIRDAAP
ncbi:Uncharacterised protein [Nocardia farcinica]|uniref:hypothetical protein n=1 Tax=Nocardia farcinica TaxID=37329 RepID=UPI000E01CACD|nr:hypothetical protein [Nocardia farcinica]SUE32290.1 Uncharacterised protein [Nocardia farcinica]